MKIQVLLLLVCLTVEISVCNGAYAKEDNAIVIPKYRSQVEHPQDSQKLSTEERDRRHQESAQAVNNGVDMMIKRDYEDALVWFHKALDTDPAKAIAYQNRAECYLKLKKPNQALEDIDHAIQLSPNEPNLYAAKVRILSELQQFASALDYASALINHTPNAKNFAIRAKLHGMMGDKPNAIRDWESAILASEQSGDDAMDEVDELETLLGHKIERPHPSIVGCDEVLSIVSKIDNSQHRFDPQFIEGITSIQLKELPTTSNEPTGAYYSEGERGYFNSIDVSTKGDIADGPGEHLWLNTYRVNITPGYIVKTFGVPDRIDDREEPGEFSYNRSWGTLIFHVHQHGFKSLYGVTLIGKKKSN